MKSLLFTTKPKLKWVCIGYLAIFLLTFFPLLLASLASKIGEQVDCEVNEGGTDPCIRLGIHIGNILNDMLTGMWLMFFTLCIGFIAFILFTYYVINDYTHYKRRDG